MKVVAEKFSSTASSEALTTMQDFLQAHPDVKVVYAFNGPIAIGAVQALRAAGKKPGEVMVLTTDMEVETQRLINDGWIQATVVSQPVTMAELSLLHGGLEWRVGALMRYLFLKRRGGIWPARTRAFG
jgi:ribose transport system substrate-binding protein